MTRDETYFITQGVAPTPESINQLKWNTEFKYSYNLRFIDIEQKETSVEVSLFV